MAVLSVSLSINVPRSCLKVKLLQIKVANEVADSTPTKPAYASIKKFCLFCCKILTGYDHHALLFGGKSRGERIAKFFLENTGIEACQNGGFSQYCMSVGNVPEK